VEDTLLLLCCAAAWSYTAGIEPIEFKVDYGAHTYNALAAAAESQPVDVSI
jgi:hypothetical protein